MTWFAEYLDEKYDSGQKLFPAHLWTKAQIKVFVGEFASKVCVVGGVRVCSNGLHVKYWNG